MELTEQEWSLLSYLLNNKKPNSNRSILTISEDQITLSPGIVVDLDKLRYLLESLNKRGLIEIIDLRTPLEEAERDEEADPTLTEIENLNIMKILGLVSEKEYEDNFTKLINQMSKHMRTTTSSKDGKGQTQLISLTRMERLLSILKLIREDVSSGYLEFVNGATLIYEKLDQYFDYVRKIVEQRRDKEKLIIIYLYPLIKDLLTMSKKVREMEEDERVKFLKNEIRIEEEIIHVLKGVLGADEQQIRYHEIRLRKLREKLDRLTSEINSSNVATTKVTFNAVDEVKSGTVSKERITELMFGTLFKDLIHEPLHSAIEKLSDLLINNLLPSLRRSGIEISLPQNLKRGEKLFVEVSLKWMNELCHVLQDSVINSQGHELLLCPNRNCLIVYHKECVRILSESGNPRCLVCGTKIL